MLDELHAMEGAASLQVRVVNIDTDPELRQHYGRRIPVLATADNGRILSECRLDSGTLRAYLAEKSAS